MLIIPAIDIQGGSCVRLKQGNFNDVTIYSDNPVNVAKKWESQGASLIHVVDLDGARKGELMNLKTIKNIADAIKIPIQVGGGIRDEKSIELLLSLGIKRIVLGTIVLEKKTLFGKILKKYSSRIIVALDVKNGALLKRGWSQQTNKDVIKTVQYLETIGIKRFIITDVINDGMLSSPNFDQIKNLKKNIGSEFIVSGGISTLADIRKLKSIGVKAIIIGKALYENKINLQEAINVG